MVHGFKEYHKSELLRNHLNCGGRNPAGERIDVTSLYLERGGKPWLPVMGEYHFSRASRDNWYTELCKMKAGGVNIVSTYLFWIYHEETEGQFDFSGDLDIRAFVLDCQKAGLDVFLRIGPWAHGECRNGGFPDWLVNKPFELRDNNPEYMACVREWYTKIYNEVKGLFYADGGNIIGVQLENELTDGAEHLAALKALAKEIGYNVPLYTVTGWNSAAGAKIPVDEVVPVFGGYPEAPWTEHTEKLEPSYNYFFNTMRNDSAIGTDLIAEDTDDDWQLPYERYPFATCELGGGIMVTHHRRPIIKPMDIYALSLVKLGSGNNLIGYYMYHGGTNKVGKYSSFNESRATGYPNDYPVLSYDFQAPLSEYGETRGQYGMLNMLHLFAEDFGETIAPMEAVMSERTPERDDTALLRYAMRTDGTSGFVFINHYQRLEKLGSVLGAVIDTGAVTFPPIDVRGDVSFFLPFNMPVGSETLEYALAQPICRKGDTYFFAAIDGITPEYRFANGMIFNPKPNGDAVKSYGIKIVTLTSEYAAHLRRLSGEIYLGIGCDLYECDGEIKAVQDGKFECYKWDGEHFEPFTVGEDIIPANAIFEKTEAPFEPQYAEELAIGGERELTWHRVSVDGANGFVEIPFECDTAQLYADGKLVADEYYYGKPWRIPAAMLFGKDCYVVTSEMKNDFYREF